jgi:5-methylthioadenosine/S-adenosylhomocysteine deaminase
MLILHGGVVLTMETEQPVIKDGAVVINGARIIDVGRFEDLTGRYPQAQVIGSKQHWILPGFVNAHHHGSIAGSSYRMGFPDLPLERALFRINNSHLLDGQISFAYFNTLNLAAQLIRSGVTCTTDFYYGDGNLPYLGSEYGLKAYQESGMRLVFILSARNQPSVDNGDLDLFAHVIPDQLKERVRKLGNNGNAVSQDRYLLAWENIYRDFHNPDRSISIFLGPDGPTRCTPGFLNAIKKTAIRHNTGIQMHLLETKYQMLHWRHEAKTSLVEYLNQSGFLGPEVSLAHSVWLTNEDMDILNKTGASTVHNASSNLRLFDGIAPVRVMLERGVNVGLGTDSYGFSDDNDFLEEIRLAALLQRVPGIEGQGLSGQTVLEMATMKGAMALGLAGQIGSLKPGKRADLITVHSERMLSPFMCPRNEPQELFYRRARREDIRDVMINGRFVMQDGKLLTISDSDVNQVLRAWYDEIWCARKDREETTGEVITEVEKIVTDFFHRYDDEALPTDYVYNVARKGK